METKSSAAPGAAVESVQGERAADPHQPGHPEKGAQQSHAATPVRNDARCVQRAARTDSSGGQERSLSLRIPEPEEGPSGCQQAQPAVRGRAQPGVALYPVPMEPPLAQPDPEDKDWTFVLDRPCPECGYVAADVDVADLPGLVLAATTPWAQVLAGQSAAVRPAPQMWSPLEYACHVRDVLRVFTGRVELIRTQDDPVFPNWDQDATAIEDRYWEQDPVAVAAELQAAAVAIAASWAGVGAAEWDRPGTRSNGSRFTLDTLGRYFLHDIVHHLHDVGGR